MSDEELPPMGMGDDMDDMDDDYGGDDFRAPPELPDGVKKTVIQEAPSENYKKPREGDDVTVHYVGTLEADGSEFDSSRSRGTPFTFGLGKGQVIKGWDLGVATMKKGEIAKFTLNPEFAYGEAGSPPKIPENATLVFEVELLSWVSKDDLFNDEGVIKSLLEEGSGWKHPKDGDEVLLSFKSMTEDGTVIEEKESFEYVVGSESLGSVSPTVSKCLMGMKKGEKSALACNKEYATKFYGDKSPNGVTVELCLLQMFETKDVSLSKDKSIMKKQVREGDGWETPKDATKVTIAVASVADGAGASIPGFSGPTTLEFVVGNGDVCDLLECAAADMKKGEKALVTCTKPTLCTEAKLGLAEIQTEKVIVTLELTEFEKGKDTWSMSEEEKLEFGQARKEIGGNLFKQQRIEMALERYKKVIELFSYIDNMKDDNKKKAAELKRVCELNKAACLLKRSMFTEAKAACDAVLKDEPQNVKALFRRANAYRGRNEHQDCIRDLDRVLDLDPENKEAKALLLHAKRAQKLEDQKSKAMFAKMCGGLGKGSNKENSAPATEVKEEGEENGKEAAAPVAEPASE